MDRDEYDHGYPITPQASDRKAEVETLLVSRDGKTPLIQRVPRPLGFRPERTR